MTSNIRIGGAYCANCKPRRVPSDGSNETNLHELGKIFCINDLNDIRVKFENLGSTRDHFVKRIFHSQLIPDTHCYIISNPKTSPSDVMVENPTTRVDEIITVNTVNKMLMKNLQENHKH
jgi:hypothetical protein